MAPLGKKELLVWAAETSGVRPCNKYADLRDGVVFLALASRLFPKSIDSRLLRRGPLDVERNWEALRCVMEQRRLPVHLCDRHAVAAGHARHCFNMLVLFFFLTKLAHNSDFCVDFSNPIDTGIAEFLQSPQSLLCVGKLPSEETKPQEGLKTFFVSSSRHSALPHPQTPPTVAASSSTVSLAITSRINGDESIHDGHDTLKPQHLRARNAHLQEELDHVRTMSQMMLTQQKALVASEVARMTEQLEVQMALVRLERDHEVRQCLIDVREGYESFLGGVKGDADSSNAFHALQGIVQTLERQLTEAHSTIQQLHNTLNEQRDRHDIFMQKIQRICAAEPLSVTSDEGNILETIASLLEAQPQPLQDAVSLRLKTLFTRIRALQSEVERLRSPSGENDTEELCCLQNQFEKLGQTKQFLENQGTQEEKSREYECREESQQPHMDWYAVPLGKGLEAPSCTIDSETCEAICAKAKALVERHVASGSPVLQAMRHLINVVHVLQARVQTASLAIIAYRDKQQTLYDHLQRVQQNAELETYKTRRAMEAKLEEQRLQIEANERAFKSKLRFVEERCSRRESVAKLLHERVRGMVLSLLKQSKSEVAPGVLQNALQQALTDIASSERTRDSLEAALAELSEEVAAQRQELAWRRREAERLQESLKVAETARQTEQVELLKVRTENHTLRDAMEVELDAVHRYVGCIGRLLQDESPPSMIPNLPLTSTVTTPTLDIDGKIEGNEREGSFKTVVTEKEKTALATKGTTAGATVLGPTSSLLSPEELERRKMLILSKYGFANRVEH